MAFGTRIKSVAFAQTTGIPQTFVESGREIVYVPPQRDVEGTGFYMPKTPAPVALVEPVPVSTQPILIAPRMPVEPPPVLTPTKKIGPDQFNGTLSPEADWLDRLPETPPPGPAVPPQEPMLEALWRKAQEEFMGPPQTPGPNFVPERGFASAQPGTRVAVAGMDMKKLVVPIALLAGAYLVSRML